MKLGVTRSIGLSLGLVLVASVSVFVSNSTSREKERSLPPLSERDESMVAKTSGRQPDQAQAPITRSANAPKIHKALDVARVSGKTHITGERLSSVRSPMNPHHDRGRVAQLTRPSLSAWRGFAIGDRITLPSFDGTDINAQIVLRTEDAGWLRLGGELAGVDGTFALNTNFDELSGFILLPKLDLAFEITTQPSGEILMVERRLEALMCVNLEHSELIDENFANITTGGTTVAQGATVPSLNTRPGAKGVVYLDFDGAEVTDPAWNGGKLISALPANLTSEDIELIVRLVAEDFAPFDLTITTNLADYNAAPPGRRMWVIVTPTTTAWPGSGGVAYINSWSTAGKFFSSNLPCWVFNSGVKPASDTISHEVGHTFGLFHDGTTLGDKYYWGHGGYLGDPTSWGPIMGAPFWRNVSQWSNGDYAAANNTEDDLSIIARDANGVGFRPDADIGTTIADAIRPLPMVNGVFDFGGLIRRSDAGDLYQFSTTGGIVSATVRPRVNPYANIDAQLELRDGTGATLALSNPAESLAASLSRSVPEGTYWLVVRAAATGARPPEGYTTGYSAYGSLGEYQLSGTVANARLTPLLPSTLQASGVWGQPFGYALNLMAGVRISEAPAPLPPGILFDAARMTFYGTPTEPGEWNVRLAVERDGAKAEGILKMRFEIPFISLAVGLDENRSIFTTPTAPWTGTIAKRFDGTLGPVVMSGVVADNMASSMRFFANGPSLMTFWWKVSSESGKDTLTCLLNGKPATDAASGQPLVISGETGWIPVQVNLPEAAKYSVEFQYSKDAILRAGSDRGWVYGAQFRRVPPGFRSHPRSVNVPRGINELKLSADIVGATKYEWKLNGVTLFDEASSTRTVSGSKTAELSIKGLQPIDGGVYTVEASNLVGTTVSKGALVQLPSLPVFTQQPVAPIGLKVGDVISLAVQVTGPGPIIYDWHKDGRPLKRTKVPSADFTATNLRASGLYKVIATNPYGTQASEDIRITISAP